MCIGSFIAANAQNFKVTVFLDPEDTVSKYYFYHTVGNNFNDPTASVDSVDVKDGKAVFTTTLNEFCEGYVCNGPIRESKSRIGIFFVPGEECIIKRQGSSYYVSGTTFYNQMSEADKYVEPYQKSYLAAANEAYDKLDAAGDKSAEIEEEVMKDAKEKYAVYKNACVDYLKSHSNQPGAVALFFNALELNTLLDITSDEVKNGFMKPLFDFEIAYEKRRQEHEAQLAEARKNVQPGMPAKEFTLKDIDGNDLALSSLRGKYLVLDFWGSWCTWCIKGMPKMKEYYAKYAGKLEILGIDCNDSDTAWKNAVKKHELPWKHVYNPRSGSTILNDYAIEGFPTKIVLDPEGKIARVIVGEDPTFYDYLDEILN